MNPMRNTDSRGANISGARPWGKGSVGGSLKFYQSPLYMLIIVASAIFISEVIIMGLIHYFLPAVSHWIENIIDASVLTILIFPVLYFFLFRPLLLYITQRKQAEEALLESEEKLHLLFQNANDSIFIIL